ncbi:MULTISPECIES: DUF4365 domain-containing protein [Sphingomonas]|uniref:DUF4365 domain-containing protein n=1 Tax=Sphingomonas TaxID=13687 RepID=UPI0013B44C36|nr:MULTISPECIES: DUF4365 domain-containing protein [Sphingomonas]
MSVVTTAETDIKERLSLGVVTLVAARAGCEVCEIKVDRTSRDVSISPIDGEIVQIDAQLKSTINLIDAGDKFKFDLPVNNYNRLRATNVGNAQILIVLDLPRSSVDWLSVSAAQVVLKRCAYWASLYGAPERESGSTVRIEFPKSQVFTPEALIDIMTRRFERIKQHHGGF